MVALLFVHVFVTLFNVAFWFWLKDFSLLCLGAIIYSGLVHSWAKRWIRANEKWLNENKKWLDRGFYTFWSLVFVYTLALMTTGVENILFLKPVIAFSLVVITVSSFVSYLRVGHGLYNTTYSGSGRGQVRRAIYSAVLRTDFIRTLHVTAVYSATIYFYITLHQLFWG